MIDALIVIDNVYREGLTSYILEKKIKKLGYSCEIVSKTIFETSIHILKPKIVIIPRINAGFEKIFQLKMIHNFEIYFIPCEHGAGDDKRIISFIANYNLKDDLSKVNYDNLKLINKIFVPSNFYKDILIKNNFFQNNQIIVSGNISTDLWFKQIKDKIKQKIEASNKTIGIATTFKTSFFGVNFNSFNEGLYFMKKILDTRNFEKKMKYDLSFLHYEMFCYIIFLKIIEDNPNHNFSIRIHPQENLKNSINLGKKINNLEIDRSTILSEWLCRQSILISSSSTVIYDAIFYDIPSFSIINLIPVNIIQSLEEVKKPMKIDILDKPKNFQEVNSLINNIDKIKPYNMSEIEKDTINKFYFPRKEFSFNIISKTIFKNYDKKKLSLFNKILKIFLTFLIKLKGFKSANLLKYRYINYDKIRNPFNIEKKYKFHKISKIFF